MKSQFYPVTTDLFLNLGYSIPSDKSQKDCHGVFFTINQILEQVRVDSYYTVCMKMSVKKI